jgi:hypothetical protein
MEYVGRRSIVVVLTVAVVAVFAPQSTARSAPAGFFGIAPQTELTRLDAAYMRAGGIRSIRWPLSWSGIQPVEDGPYLWAGFDHVVRVAARHRLRVLPFLSATPSWAAPDFRIMPVVNRAQRRSWGRFVKAAVRRYGPGGGFWRAHPAVPRLPIRAWQVWNEANFFYFARPISPRRYGRLVKLTSRAVKRIDPRVRVILSGLFGSPRERRGRGLAAVRFLDALYRVRRIERFFDGVALHPYAARVGELKTLVAGMRSVTRRNSDPRVPLFITEMGWGSQNDPKVVAFERGLKGQARELRRAYRYLLRNRRRLHIKAAYWFSWKDLAGSCNFCDSAGLFYGGAGFSPKPAWRTFVDFTGGHPQP